MSLNPYPPPVITGDISQKQLWVEVFVSAIRRADPDEAANIADWALDVCNKRWENADDIGSWQFKHSYPIGHVFPKKA